RARPGVAEGAELALRESPAARRSRGEAPGGGERVGGARGGAGEAEGRMIRRALAIGLAWAALAGVARAAVPTVAVMPFKDLSGGRGAVGEAIRETVTSDLESVPGLKVVERSNLDRVLAEQNLQSARSDLDPLSTVKVGRLLGASLIVAGAYQRAAQTVRLTARFVKVETGEVVGTAKVDGPAADFLRLQDRVTTALLRSAGISGPAVQRFARRARPKLKSMKSVELYGDAVVQTDDQKKEGLLKLALNEDPGFVYAARDLDALEKRMKGYEASATRAQEQQLAELRGKLAHERDPQKKSALILQVMSGLQSSRRWHTLERTARALLAGPPLPPPAIGAASTDEIVAFYLVQSEGMLRERDGQLADGERF